MRGENITKQVLDCSFCGTSEKDVDFLRANGFALGGSVQRLQFVAVSIDQHCNPSHEW